MEARQAERRAASPLESGAPEGDSPVAAPPRSARARSRESCCLGLQHKAGGKFHLKLNMDGRPIANKYREGKMKRTMCNGVKRA